MMRPLHFFVLPTITTVLFSCNPCDNIACDSIPPYGMFRIVSAYTGKDLVFGPDKIYDKNQIKFYALNTTDTAFFDYRAIKTAGSGFDSILHVRFLPPSEIAYMRLSDGDIDTLNITYMTTTSKCCGTSTSIRNFLYNNSYDFPSDKGPQELKK